jgi:hypothetical protein
MASALVVGFFRSTPRTAEVMVLAPSLRIPRIAMHRCSHSTTTITPRGVSRSIRVSDLRGETFLHLRRLAYTSTSRASFDSPVIRPSRPGR